MKKKKPVLLVKQSLKCMDVVHLRCLKEGIVHTFFLIFSGVNKVQIFVLLSMRRLQLSWTKCDVEHSFLKIKRMVPSVLKIYPRAGNIHQRSPDRKTLLDKLANTYVYVMKWCHICKIEYFATRKNLTIPQMLNYLL